MGMAASQARLLGLGSKKTNSEWQGQQINQARTALANKTGDLWQELFSMKAPNAPKVTDYTESSYSFNDGQTDYEINSIDSSSSKSGYNAKVTYTHYVDGCKGVEVSNTNPQVQKTYSAKNDGKVEIEMLPSGSIIVRQGGTVVYTGDPNDVTDTDIKEQLVKAGVISDKNQKVSSYIDPATNEVKYVAGDLPTTIGETKNMTQFSNLSENGYKVGTSTTEIADVVKDETVKSALAKIAEDFPESEIAKAINNGEDIYTYSKNGTINYACIKDLEDAVNSASGIDKQSPMNLYQAQMYREAITRTDDAIVEKDSSGRYTTVALSKYSDSPMSLHSESRTDMTAYDNAMTAYKAEKEAYEEKVEWINKKTKKIQEEDRTLELRLKNLDTERNALQNEMSTIKKIMEKKVDEVFKTFQ